MSFKKNSAITCLQEPQGETAPLLSATTAISVNEFSPAEIALKIATLSAQQLTGKAAFSILHPVYILPVSVSNAAPTLKLEYGVYAFDLPFNALLINEV